MRTSVDTRFWSKVNKNGPLHPVLKTRCWLWIASNARGYGTFKLDGIAVRANRIAWVLTHGALPRERCVLHRCDNPPCVNPEHLFLGTQVENILDLDAKGRYVSANAQKTHCKRGHPLSGANAVTVQRHTGSAFRSCRKCQRLRDKKYRAGRTA